MIPLEELLLQLKSKAPYPVSVTLMKGQVIRDIPKLIKSHETVLKAYPGDKTKLPYYQRLFLLNSILNDSQL